MATTTRLPITIKLEAGLPAVALRAVALIVQAKAGPIAAIARLRPRLVGLGLIRLRLRPGLTGLGLRLQGSQGLAVLVEPAVVPELSTA